MRTSLVPYLLIYSRLLIGFLILLLSIYHIPHYPAIAVTLLVIGLLTDIFDGIIARRLNVSTERLRRLDSTVDQVFFVTVPSPPGYNAPAFSKRTCHGLSSL
jgi:CDP-diacylglycerol--glycerol-3-phosphate 3-phosphatidyltransferase